MAFGVALHRVLLERRLHDVGWTDSAWMRASEVRISTWSLLGVATADRSAARASSAHIGWGGPAHPESDLKRNRLLGPLVNIDNYAPFTL